MTNSKIKDAKKKSEYTKTVQINKTQKLAHKRQKNTNRKTKNGQHTDMFIHCQSFKCK